MLPIKEDTPLKKARDIVAKELENVLTSFDKIKTYLDVDKDLRDVMLYDVDFCRNKVMDIRGKL